MAAVGLSGVVAAGAGAGGGGGDGGGGGWTHRRVATGVAGDTVGDASLFFALLHHKT